MADVIHHRPHIFLGELAAGGWHARRLDTVPDDPLQLAIRVGLNLGSREGRNRRGKGRGERHPGILAIQAVAHHAIGDEELLALFDALWSGRNGVAVLLTVNRNVVLRPGNRLAFELAWRAGLAAKQERGEGHDKQARIAAELKGHRV